MKSKKNRFRFAPSPTGFLHIGGLRSALFIYLAAKANDGKFILRIEDTDEKREVEGAVEGLIDIFKKLDIEFDESPVVGGDYGPYVQSERLSIYKKHTEEILAKDGAYHCFCTPERLEKMRADQQANKLPPRYDRICRNLTKEEVKEKIKKGEKYVIRQKMPLDGEIVVHDLLRGEIKFNMTDLDDHVLIKTSGMPTYQFANVVDDHTMEITHVLRGTEWISSFPKNILLYQAFGWEAPKYAHIPLLLNKDGGKLSKRQGDVSAEDFLQKGYIKEALLNFCVLLGWHPKDDNEILSLKDMVKKFKIEDISLSPAIFDTDKLDYLNGYYIRQKPLKELVKLCRPYLEENLSITKNKNKKSDKFIEKVISLEQERMKKLSEVSEITKFFFADKLAYDKNMLIWKKMDLNSAQKNLKEIFDLLEKIPEKQWTKESLEKNIVEYIKSSDGKIGEYLWPMRVSLTGERASPGPFEVAETLGREESLERIKKSLT